MSTTHDAPTAQPSLEAAQNSLATTAGFSYVQIHNRRLHRSVFTPINRAIHGIATK